MNWAPTVALALVAALVCGVLARRLGLSPIVGYLLAGVLLGPHTPGFIADATLAGQLADVGVVLLMFGVGLGFSFGDLWSVRSLAVPGALVASSVALLGGAVLGQQIGWSLSASMVFGMCLATASTVVIVRGLMELDLMGSAVGRTAIGWSVVEDLITVVLLVVLPTLAPAAGGEGDPLWQAIVWTVAKVALMAAVVIVGGGFVVPRLLALVARVQSRELFTLAVLTVALGVAYLASTVFGVSLALGAFFGGMVVGRSDLSHQAAADALPLRDAFAVLFFVAVGMLFDPFFVLQRPLLVGAALLVVLVAKPFAAIVLLLVRGQTPRAALSVAAAVAQVSEFSFVLAGLAVDLDILPADGRQLVLAVALLSIILSPVLFRGISLIEASLARWRWLQAYVLRRSRGLARLPDGAEPAGGHIVLVGYGRVGSMIGSFLAQRSVPFLVVELDRPSVEQLRARGIPALYGDASSPILLDRAGIKTARALVLTSPDPVAQRLAIEHARSLRGDLPIFARVHSQSQRDLLTAFSGVRAVHGEEELGYAMARLLLQALGASVIEADATVLAAQGGAEARTQLRLFEIRVPFGSPVVGSGIKDLSLPTTALIVAVVRQGHLVVPRGATTLVANDKLLLFASSDDAQKVETLVGALDEAQAAEEPGD